MGHTFFQIESAKRTEFSRTTRHGNSGYRPGKGRYLLAPADSLHDLRAEMARC